MMVYTRRLCLKGSLCTRCLNLRVKWCLQWRVNKIGWTEGKQDWILLGEVYHNYTVSKHQSLKTMLCDRVKFLLCTKSTNKMYHLSFWLCLWCPFSCGGRGSGEGRNMLVYFDFYNLNSIRNYISPCLSFWLGCMKVWKLWLSSHDFTLPGHYTTWSHRTKLLHAVWQSPKFA